MEKKSKLKFIYYESRLDFLKQEESFSKEGYVKDLYKKLPQLNEDNKLTVKNLVSFWKAIIIKSCRILKTLEGNLTDVETSSRFTISVQHLFETFTFHGYRPSCLEQVLDIMKQEGSLESLDMYNSDAFNGFLNWFFKSLKGLFWSYDKNLEKLVVLPAVEVSNYIYLNIFMSLSNKIESETFYDEVLKKSHDFVDCLFSMDDLLKKRHELSSCIFTDGDLKIVLRFLQRRGRVLVDSKNDVIKFVKKKSSISSNDYQILQVKNTLEKVRSLYHKFSAQIDE